MPPEPPVSQLERVALVLDALQLEGFLTLTEVSVATGIPCSSAQRLLERMVKLRWLLRVGDRYELGARLFELGSEAIRNHWFYRIVYPHLVELQERTQLIVHLAYLDGGDVVYWEKLSGSMGVRVPTRIGGRQPAYRTALGKALLAAESDRCLEHPAFNSMKRSTPATIIDRDELTREVDRVNNDGVAFDHGEALVDIGCIAANVHAGHASTSDGYTTTAAISICGPLGQIRREMINSVRAAANQITRAAAVNPMIDT
ncbi:IclR family transcriptional regulator [Antrihabitans cavernicola]|uniref:IclR family transcriptional regulator n=1 Tax=Antrihabitans cavernicola TaxID=2495913 RepID=A0A5A7S2F8_9NOCA|nr:IclR family transcriptional regulator [Spelaeibacter cavernicola]KAA0015982.1 IclR family transcriptional regulator [Spelaeibacter cavernicola]